MINKSALMGYSGVERQAELRRLSIRMLIYK